MKRIRAITRDIIITGTCIISLLLALPAAPVSADAPVITLDGDFSDWTGQMYITDPVGDATNPHRDFTAFYWANNPDDETCYWMLERSPSSWSGRYVVFLDANNNGEFREHVDRIIQVMYRPLFSGSRVNIIVRYGDTGQRISSVYNRDWGESISEGGSKVEFGVSFAELGIGVGQTIRMYAIAYQIIPFSGFLDNITLEDLIEFIESLDLEELEEFLGDAELEDLQEFLENVDLNELWQFLNNPELREELEQFILLIIGGSHIIDRVPDSGDIQWSPVSILGYPLLISIMVVGGICIWYFKGRKRWSLRR
jgi:hypothetical protein